MAVAAAISSSDYKEMQRIRRGIELPCCASGRGRYGPFTDDPSFCFRSDFLRRAAEDASKETLTLETMLHHLLYVSKDLHAPVFAAQDCETDAQPDSYTEGPTHDQMTPKYINTLLTRLEKSQERQRYILADSLRRQDWITSAISGGPHASKLLTIGSGQPARVSM
jgi:hypothetical protein